MRAKTSLAFASALMSAAAVLAAPADAACKKFGFTVNDYGKDGPTNDAKNLLDKHISEWAAQNGVTDYTTGKKSVSCELFLDVILFDEHTCTASATVCWGPDAKKLGAQSAAAPEGEESSAGAPPAPVRKAHALGLATPQATAAAAPAATAPADVAAAPATDVSTDAAAAAPQMDAAPTVPVEQIAAPSETPPAAPAVHAAPQAPAASAGGTPGGVVETGALQAGQALPQSSQKPATSEKDRAAAASAAASAAAAAERAAVAAETAANAAKEAAAAAVAASAASKGPATVPPLSHAAGGAPSHNE